MLKSKTGRKLVLSTVVIILLCIALVGTATALSLAIVQVEDNAFTTGEVRLNLNNGEPVISEDEFLFEPGMTVTKTFFIQNNSSWDVYYRFYLENIKGDLSRILDITVSDGDTVLCSGMAVTLEKSEMKAVDDILKIGEIRQFTLTIHFPEQAGNEYQGEELYFDLCSEAVQAKNNPDRLFD